MKLFDGLYPFEIVLLLLGVLLFLVSLVAFLRLVMRGGSLGSLPLYFLISVAMIGYPSIRSIQYGNGVLTIEKTTDQLKRDPSNAGLRQRLETEVAHLATRPSAKAETQLTFARAYTALGQEAAADQRLTKALKINPNLQVPRELLPRVESLPNRGR